MPSVLQTLSSQHGLCAQWNSHPSPSSWPPSNRHSTSVSVSLFKDLFIYLLICLGCPGSSWRWAGLSLRWLLLLLWNTGSRHAGSVVVAHGLSCYSSMWDLPGPGMEPASPASAGGFLTSRPPGKPCSYDLTTPSTSYKWNHAILHVWFLSHSMMPSRSVHALAGVRISFLFEAE